MASTKTVPLSLIQAKYPQSYGPCAPTTGYMAETSDIPLGQGTRLSQPPSVKQSHMYQCAPPGNACMTYNSRHNNTKSFDYIADDPSRQMYAKYLPKLMPKADAYDKRQNDEAEAYIRAGKCEPSPLGPAGISNTMEWAQTSKIASFPYQIGSQTERDLGAPYEQNLQDTFSYRATVTSHPRFSMHGVSEREAVDMYNQAQYADICRSYCGCEEEGDGLI